MTLLDFARGPALSIAFAVFLIGVLWRLFSLVLLPKASDNSPARADSGSAFGQGLRGFWRHMWPADPYLKSSVFALVNGYAFHLGLAIVVFGLAQHIQFIKDVFGISWPGLPTGVITLAAIVTLASLVGALVRRLTNPVLKLISTGNDYITWLVTVLPVITGIMTINHLRLRYETLLALHILSFALMLVWFPFGKLMHAFLVFLTRSRTGVVYGRRGVKI